MFKNLLLIIFLVISPLFISAKEIKIEAIIGNELITTYDIDQRIKIVELTTGKKIPKDNHKLIKNQIRELLINEEVQRIATENANIKVSQRELNKALAKMAKDNRLKLSEFKRLIKRKKINYQNFQAQIKNSLAWHDFVYMKIRPQIKISDNEVEHYLNKGVGKKADNYKYLLEIVEISISDKNEENYK